MAENEPEMVAFVFSPDYRQWQSTSLAPGDMLRFYQCGWSPTDVTGLFGVTFPQWHDYTTEPWATHLFNPSDRANWHRVGVSDPKAAASWSNLGLNHQAASRYVAAGIVAPGADLIRRWEQSGVPRHQRQTWVLAGFTDPDEVSAWRATGYGSGLTATGFPVTFEGISGTRFRHRADHVDWDMNVIPVFVAWDAQARGRDPREALDAWRDHSQPPPPETLLRWMDAVSSVPDDPEAVHRLDATFGSWLLGRPTEQVNNFADREWESMLRFADDLFEHGHRAVAAAIRLRIAAWKPTVAHEWKRGPMVPFTAPLPHPCPMT